MITVLALCAVPTAPADVAMSVTAVAGFDGFFRAGEWVPVTLSVENLAGRFRGEVEVSLRWGERFSKSSTVVSFRRRIDLAGSSGDLVPFVLPLNNPALPVTVRFISDDGSNERHQLTLRSRPVRGSLVIALSRRPNLDFLLSGRSVTVAYPLPGYLPVDSSGYDGVSAVVVHDVDLSVVNDSRLAALEEWVDRGGTVLVSGGPALLSRTPGPIDRFLPVDVGGLAVARGSVGIVELLRDGDIPIVASRPRQAPGISVLARTDELPLVVEAASGNGRVIFLAYDYASVGSAQAELWARVLDGGAAGGRPIDLRRRIFETPVLADLLDLPLYEFPPFGIVAAFVAAYAATLIMLVAGRRVRWTLVPTTLAVAAVFGVAAHLWLNEAQQPAAALFMEYDEIVVEANRPHAGLRKDFIVFSTRPQRYEVSVPTGLPVPLEDRDLSVRVLDDGFAVTDIEVDRWSLRNFHVAASVELPLEVSAEARGEEVQVLAHNRSYRTIDDAYVLHRGTITPLGRIGPDQRVSVEFVPVASSERPNGSDQSVDGRARRKILQLEAGRQSWEDSGEALLIGFLPESPLPATPDRHFARRFSVSVVKHALEVSR